MHALPASLRRDRSASSGRILGLVVARTLIAFAALGGCALFALHAERSSVASGGAKGRRAEAVAAVLSSEPDPAPAPPIRKRAGASLSFSDGLGYFAALLGGTGDLAERDAAEAQDRNDVLRFEGAKVRRGVVDAIDRAARRAKVDPVMLMAIADKESSFSTDVKASTSSATGLFQFIESTWLRAVREFGPRYGLAAEAAAVEGPDEKPFVADPAERQRILDMRTYPYLSALLAAECLKSARGRLADVVGREPTIGETYLTHFLGTQGATLFMQSYVAQPKVAAASLFKAPARANKPIFYAGKRGKALSIADVREKFEDMMDTRVRRYARLGQTTRALAYSE